MQELEEFQLLRQDRDKELAELIGGAEFEPLRFWRCGKKTVNLGISKLPCHGILRTE